MGSAGRDSVWCPWPSCTWRPTPLKRSLGLGEVPETLFEEHRGFTSPFIGFVVAVAIGLGWGFAESYGVGLDADTGLFVLGGVAFLAALLALFAWTPGTSECKNIRINRAGSLSAASSCRPARSATRSSSLSMKPAGPP